MLSILINAYACSPNMGSEPGMAWNWCINLAKYCELHIITEGEFRDKIEKELPLLPQGKNMHFYYNPVPDKIRKMCWHQGDWRFYYYYRKWQKKTLTIAQNIISETSIDVVHQLNMIGFREPGYLWKLKKPFIWGPINAKESFPTPYLKDTKLKNKVFIFLKNNINKFQLKTAFRVNKAAKKAKFIIAASSDSAYSIKKYFHCDSILINESGCDITNKKFQRLYNNSEKILNLLWVGRFIFTKQLELAIKTIADCNNSHIRLHIVGGSKEEEVPYQKLTQKLDIKEQCRWYHKLPHSSVQKLMQRCDVFFFTSIAEGTPHVILEALNNSLPVLCFNTCGHGDCIDSSVGFKIELSTPQQSIQEFARIINRIQQEPEMLQKMANNCSQRQEALSWENKAKQVIQVYKSCNK